MDRQILKLALPSIVSNITVPLLGLCDVTIMGHVGGAAHIGAIAVGSMIFNVMYWLFGFLRMGTSGMTAQAYGLSTRKEKGGTRSEDTIASSKDTIVSSDCSAFLRRGLQVGIGIGLLFVVLQVPLRHLSLWLMQAEGEVRTLAIPYYNICIWGAPAMLGLYALTGWFIGMQNTKIPMAIAIGQNVLNIGASLLFVLVLGMGVEGVALGTVIAQWAGFLVALACSVRVFGFRWRTEGRVSTRRYFVTNSFIFLRTLCLVAVNLYFTSAGAAQGAEILAANTLLMQLFTLFSYVMDGFAYAGEALAGRYYGAGYSQKLTATIGRLFRWGLGVALLFTLLYWIGGTSFLHLLTTDGHVIETASCYLGWAVLIPLSGMAAFVWDGIYIGVTATRGMFLSCLVASVIFFAAYFLLRSQLGNHALWIALLSYLAVRGVVQSCLKIR